MGGSSHFGSRLSCVFAVGDKFLKIVDSLIPGLRTMSECCSNGMLTTPAGSYDMNQLKKTLDQRSGQASYGQIQAMMALKGLAVDKTLSGSAPRTEVTGDAAAKLG